MVVNGEGNGGCIEVLSLSSSRNYSAGGRDRPRQ
jgi:hypothetical protein